MKFFIDTAKVEDIKAANDMGVICGVTTNPSLIAKEGRDFKEVIKEITSIVDGPISGEVKATTTDAEGMIKEGREIAAIHPTKGTPQGGILYNIVLNELDWWVASQWENMPTHYEYKTRQNFSCAIK